MNIKIFSSALLGLESKIIEVEADTSPSLPGLLIVGLPDKTVEESKERVRAAIRQSGFSFPKGKITVNLAPADIKKEGSLYDLPIALSILALNGLIKDHKILERSIFIGELALDGRLRPINGVLAIAQDLKKQHFENLFLPQENALEASLIKEINVFPCSNLKEVLEYLLKIKELKPIKTEIKDFFSSSLQPEYDWLYIKGQEQAKRALEIAAAGAHNVLLSGSPGAGKTMLAKSLPSVLPSLTLEEALEVTRIYSVAGLLSKDKPLITNRPFRSPHHSASAVAIVGGGSNPKPGEISLAHRGVLFLDEFPEFARNVLENLRQPLEEGEIFISRASTTLRFPAKFMLIAAMNPCPCGFYSDPVKECRCSPAQIIRYQKKISGPLLDRIDLYVEVPRLKIEKLVGEVTSESSQKVKERVEKARQIQKRRFEKLNILTNAEMDNRQVKEFCKLDEVGENLLKKAVVQLNLTARAYFKILKIARTIADLEGEENIKPHHIAESLQFRPKFSE